MKKTHPISAKRTPKKKKAPSRRALHLSVLKAGLGPAGATPIAPELVSSIFQASGSKAAKAGLGPAGATY
ncbi:MAG: hypothetical protein JNJ49_08915 [Bdellovibrionaceae bacterium]|nr:hypothetical protein [Pseudobdellovibrionaceae bacterium]